MKNSLEYFVGKICTVFTSPTNRDFKSENPQTFPQPLFHYFVGKVLEISQKGIWIEQWNSEKKLRTFFFMSHVISISEEEILDPSKPDDMRAIEEYKKANESFVKESAVEEPKPQEKYIDINSLSRLAQKANV